jgi:Fe-S-cluster containining protein
VSLLGSVEEMISTMESGVWDYIKNGECSGCGNCCGNILPISSKEIKRIKRYVEKHDIKEQIRRYPTSTPTIDMQCPFRDEIAKRCTIYPVRPAICQDFRCDKPKKQIRANKALYDGKYDPVDMRATFYGRENVFAQFVEKML